MIVEKNTQCPEFNYEDLNYHYQDWLDKTF